MSDPKSECEELQDRVTEYLERVLGPDESRWFEGHVNGCGGCGQLLEEMKAVIELLHRMGPCEVTPEARAQLRTLFESWKQTRVSG